MSQFYYFCLNVTQQLSATYAALNLQLILLIGSGLLAIALLILSLTSWGRERPVWKCVVLSVMAHLLLMGYAYGTHMIFPVETVVENSTPLEINIVEDSGPDLKDNNLEANDGKPWNEFVNKTPLPEAENLARPFIDTTIELKRSTPDEVLLDPPTEVEPNDLVAKPEAGELEADNPLASLAIEDSEFGAYQIDEPLEAQEIDDIQRRGDDEMVAQDFPQMDTDNDFERPEIAPADTVSDWAPEVVDSEVPFTSDFIDKSAEMPLVDPAPASSARMSQVSVASQPRTRMRVVNSPRRLLDGRELPEIYSQRAVSSRLEVAQKRGGSPATERAVIASLKWLADNQSADGRWNPRLTGAGRETQVFGHNRQGAGTDADTGISSLALLAFLAGGHTHLEGPYQKNVQTGLEYLLKNQSKDGNLAGNARMFARMYCHSMSLLALSEALAITGDQRLVAPVQRGVDFTVAAQNRIGGGWRYLPGDEGDMSQFGWQVLALHSAKAGGASVPDKTIERMHNFIDKATSGVGGGLASYRPGQGVSTTMTAEALVCRYFLNQSVSNDTRMTAAKRIMAELPSEHHINLYYWYYATMAMYHAGGPEWEQWNQAVKKALLATQVISGKDAGCWEPNGLWAGYGGRVYSTAMSALCLQIYYRYLPMYEKTTMTAEGGGATRRR